MMKSTASQIRQDLNCFGGFGQQGYGYNVELLREQIASILGLGHAVPAILVGAGNLGRTIANQVDFSGSGFRGGRDAFGKPSFGVPAFAEGTGRRSIR